MKVLSIFGTRPEAIKMAPVVKELEKHEEIESFVCVTAQHRQMLDQVLESFEITPDFDLNIMKDNQTLSQITTSALIELDTIIKKLNPDFVLVHGDTTTTFVASLASFYNKTKVAHIEAGLRTYDKYSPFPEEMNRQLTDTITDVYFAPTEISKQNLLLEGKDKNKIIVTGNTAIDALKTTINEDYDHAILNKLKKEKIILLTTHRRENQGNGMKNIFEAVKKIADEFQDVHIVYPIHMNPKIRELATDIYRANYNKIHLISPLDVVDFHNFMKRSYFIMTDSGGIQEEASYLGKPVLVLREKTERPEGIRAGTLKLTGLNKENIFNEAKKLLTDTELYEKMSIASNVYGDGNASAKIVEYLLSCN
ncbi:MAG: UDP-N-acetylglucosamine 2-epimerase (non-hydrolyzing) [Clostridioides sp.]|jgi:UDP-N-acetylglucosamine 2-epimerase (non-hydrolysing)|nr:UDP-N-acetylglucosamine 2-epimerase (non-hydrolyzing) [Clostridioides sp.]